MSKQTPQKLNWADAEELEMPARVDPKDISVRIGPALTEEQFKAFCAAKGIANPTVVKTKKK